MDPVDRGLRSARLTVVGREVELSALAVFAKSEGVARALFLSGEPGAGKTTLWEAGVDLASDEGFLVLASRASAAEARLSFAGLADLLDGVDFALLAGLPSPQLHALEVAVRRASPMGGAPEPLAISVGFLNALRLFAVRQPVLIAVDDVQWLDRESAETIAYVGRRLVHEKLRFLVSGRPGRLPDFEGVFGRSGADRLAVESLSYGALARLLSMRLGLNFPRSVLRRIFETSQGNPLFALELGRTLVARGMPEMGDDLPVPDVLDDLFAARVAGLAKPIRRALLAVALSGEMSRSDLASIVDPLALDDALAAGILVAERSRIRLSHPLLGAAAIRRSSALERRDLHRDLTAAVEDEVLRARHLALAAVAPDSSCAEIVAAAASVASGRGAVRDAVELAAHALRLTEPEAAERGERVLALARCLMSAGDLPRMIELLTNQIDKLAAGRIRGLALLQVGEAADSIDKEDHLIERALGESAGDPSVRANALARRSILIAVNQIERIDEAEAYADEALIAARSAGAEVQSRALLSLAWARVLRGRPTGDLSEQFPPASVNSSLYECSIERPLGVQLAFRGEIHQARSVFHQLHALADDRGEVRSGFAFYIQLCEVELRAGEAEAAARLIDEWDEWTDDENRDPLRGRCHAMLATLRGLPEETYKWAATTFVACEVSPGHGWDRLEVMRASGIAALFGGEPEVAVESLRAVWDHTIRERVDEPGAFPVAPDLVEALVETGAIASAREVTERLRRLADAQQHPWGMPTASRCAAVVQLAERYDDEAAAQLAAAASAYCSLGLRFDQARALLHLGRVQRRFKKRAAARRTLEEAEAVFAHLGCHGWAAATRSELARVSGRRATAEGELSPTEQLVVDLAASGHSNKEIARHLFVSTSTIEGHLSHAYAKLGIRSRAQLARRLGASDA